METRIVGEPHQFYPRGSADLRMVGRRSVEWDLNDWKWDGDVFMATPIGSVAADCRSRQLFPVAPSSIPENRGFSNSSAWCSDEVNLEVDKGKREMEKRRRAIVIEDDDLNDGTGNLALKLGGCTTEREDWEGMGGKKTKIVGPSSSRAVCQVEGCESDLSSAKDYHRRHKVCETHSKATKAIVGNVLQRFCQQCSRFHTLQEFDEGKRSCRRRLAGHNKRRRKTQPETTATGNHGDDQASGYLIISLLKILANMHSNKSDETKDQNLLSHILKSIASNAGAPGGHNLSSLQGLLAARTTGNSEMVSALLSNSVHPPTVNHPLGPSSQLPESRTSVEEATPQPSVIFPLKNSPPGYSDAGVGTAGHTKMTNFDLNDVYIDSDNDMENLERSTVPVNLGAGSFGCPLWLQQDGQQSSPPQTSRNSDSASAQSPSSSNGDTQSRTDRIVFKLFGKKPNDFPIGLRTQILDWLSHSPSDIESYIRPGCVVLTIYLRLDDSKWEELCDDLSSSLSKLLDASEDTFWRLGWIYVRVQHQTALVYNGEVVLDASLPLESYNYSQISSVTPIALSITEKAQFSIKGLNLSRPPTRLLCALEGKYLIEDNSHEQDATNSLEEHDEFQPVTFSCSIPTVTGRGFFEVEDDGLSSSFCPFLVAENDICSEIRMLENAIDLPADEDSIGTDKLDAKSQAMEFICEMGWLFHRCQLKSRLSDSDPNMDLFPLKRFKWLMEFSMDRDWCAVVKKLLGIMLKGVVSSEEHPSLVIALAEMGLLHRAVRRNSRPLVQLLLRYVPEEFCKQEDEHRSVDNKGNKCFLFTPDAAGPAGVTPLHIAAGTDGSENVLDDLLDDPGMVGVVAWNNARDNTGYTPEDYASLRGNYSYNHMVQKKFNRRPGSGQVVVDIPGAVPDYKTNRKQNSNNKSTTGFDIETYKSKLTQKSCKLCEQKMVYGNMSSSRSLVYRPAMLSMVAIAAVCVCVALLFKSSPEVLFVFRPFRWDMLDYGSS